jgi:hypothetical protein
MWQLVGLLREAAAAPGPCYGLRWTSCWHWTRAPGVPGCREVSWRQEGWAPHQVDVVAPAVAEGGREVAAGIVCVGPAAVDAWDVNGRHLEGLGTYQSWRGCPAACGFRLISQPFSSLSSPLCSPQAVLQLPLRGGDVVDGEGDVQLDYCAYGVPAKHCATAHLSKWVFRIIMKLTVISVCLVVLRELHQIYKLLDVTCELAYSVMIT